MHTCMDVWMDGSMDGQKEGWMDVYVHIYIYIRKCAACTLSRLAHHATGELAASSITASSTTTLL